MGRLEVACREFAVLSGIQQEADDYAICVHPRAASLQRKGTLAILTEPSGDHPSLSTEACRLVQSAIIEHYFADQSLGLTTGLVNAIDSANTALLEYNYSQPSPHQTSEPSAGGVAVQAGGIRTRRARVGLTVALLRPDGAGIYLSQLSPTQAYLVHKGLLTALPEPASWQPENGHKVITLRRVPDSDDESDEANDGSAPSHLPAPSLGSGPGVEADLFYRRVEPGDLLVMVSSSLSRRLDRDTVEQVCSSGDADSITEALRLLATEQGLAEAHACVIQFGVDVSSGVEADYTGHYLPTQGEEIATNGGAHSDSAANQPAGLPVFKEALKGPRDWFRKRGAGGPEEVEPGPAAGPGVTAEEEYGPAEPEPEPLEEPALPTQTLLQRSLDIPPYKANALTHDQQPAHGQDKELEFDGWEDNPPALDDLPFLKSNPRPSLERDLRGDSYRALPNTNGNGNGSANGNAYHNGNGTSHVLDPTRPYLNMPAIFPDEDDDFDALSAQYESEAVRPAQYESEAVRPARHSKDYSAMGRNAVNWTTGVLRGLLPERLGGIPAPAPWRRSGLFSSVPTRVVIAIGVVLLVGILAFSVLKMAGNQKHALVNTYLQEAQQEEQLANQTGMLPADKLQHLQTALGKAQQAVSADPQSQEAQLFAGKVQDEIDQAQGITRLANLKLIFNLDDADSAATTTTTTAAGQTASNVDNKQTGAGTETTAGATQTGSIIVQGNDAYVLDKQHNKIYHCIISTKACEASLKGGDSVGGQTVGNIIAMTMRISSPLAVDDKFVAYVYDSDSGAWQAQPLGGNNGLQQPLDIASYDGNLYLLGAKPGQVSKYISGRYGDTPEDWIKDPAVVDQLKNPVSMAIDGSVYVLTNDGKIVTMQGGKAISTITPKSAGAPSAPTSLYTNTDTHDLYLLRASDSSITRITKEGQTVAIIKGSNDLPTLTGITVDEGRSKIFLMQGRKVYEGILPSRVSLSPNQPADTTGTTGGTGTTAPVPAPQTNQQQPLVRPTAEP